jgi:hypothetical protein
MWFTAVRPSGSYEGKSEVLGAVEEVVQDEMYTGWDYRRSASSLADVRWLRDR